MSASLHHWASSPVEGHSVPILVFTCLNHSKVSWELAALSKASPWSDVLSWSAVCMDHLIPSHFEGKAASGDRTHAVPSDTGLLRY